MKASFIEVAWQCFGSNETTGSWKVGVVEH